MREWRDGYKMDARRGTIEVKKRDGVGWSWRIGWPHDIVGTGCVVVCGYGGYNGFAFSEAAADAAGVRALMRLEKKERAESVSEGWHTVEDDDDDFDIRV